MLADREATLSSNTTEEKRTKWSSVVLILGGNCNGKQHTASSSCFLIDWLLDARNKRRVVKSDHTLITAHTMPVGSRKTGDLHKYCSADKATVLL